MHLSRGEQTVASLAPETYAMLDRLSEDMERDIGKVYRKYERLERTIRAERDRKIALKQQQGGGGGGGG